MSENGGEGEGEISIQCCVAEDDVSEKLDLWRMRQKLAKEKKNNSSLFLFYIIFAFSDLLKVREVYGGD